MADNHSDNFEHEFSDMLKSFDAKIKIPEMPDAQAIFDRAEQEKPKGKVIKFKYIGTVAAAAVVVIMLIALPALGKMSMGTKSAAPEAAMKFDMNTAGGENALVDSFVPEEESAETESSAMSSSVTLNNPVTGGSEDGMLTVAPYGINSINDVLETYFSSNAEEIGSKRTESNSAESYTETFGKKRSIDVGIESDSVSIMLNDDSGEREILAAFWVEGVYQSAYESEGIYIINLVSYVAREDFESGSYMPLVGDAQKGTYSLPEEDVYVPDEISEAVFNISVNINIETGTYEIFASLT